MKHFEFQPGVTYIVIQAFDDFEGEHFKVGERLTFISESLFVYDDIYTYRFQGRTAHIRGVEEPHIPSHLQDYFRPASLDEWSRDGIALTDKMRDRTPKRLRKKKK